FGFAHKNRCPCTVERKTEFVILPQGVGAESTICFAFDNLNKSKSALESLWQGCDGCRFGMAQGFFSVLPLPSCLSNNPGFGEWIINIYDTCRLRGNSQCLILSVQSLGLACSLGRAQKSPLAILSQFDCRKGRSSRERETNGPNLAHPD